MKVLERFRFKTTNGSDYMLITTGILPESEYGPTERLGFITGPGLDSVRCSWTDKVSEGQQLTLQLSWPDGERRVLRTTNIVSLKTRRCWFGYQRYAYTGKRVC